MEVAKLKIHGAEKELIVDKENDYLLSDQYYWRAIKRNCGNHVYYTVQGYKRGGEMMGRSHKLFYIHRLIMGSPKGMTIDHINGDVFDNRKCNLRICTQGENSRNGHKQNKSISGYKGVIFDKRRNKYECKIKYNYKSIFLGCFIDPVEAAKIYDKKAVELFGEFACLNFPGELSA
jgi:hypothetical protein